MPVTRVLAAREIGKTFLPERQITWCTVQRRETGETLFAPRWGGGEWGAGRASIVEKISENAAAEIEIIPNPIEAWHGGLEKDALERNDDEKKGKIPRAGKNDPRTRRGFRLHGSEDAVERKRFRELLFEIKKERRKKKRFPLGDGKASFFPENRTRLPGAPSLREKIIFAKTRLPLAFFNPPACSRPPSRSSDGFLERSFLGRDN